MPATPDHDRWTAVDRYLADRLLKPDAALDAALAAGAAAGLPAHGVTPTQGRLLELLARIQGARTILELGTLGGYSTIWLGRGLPPDGRLVTLEVNPHYAEVARANLARAGMAEVVELHVGLAETTLARLAADGDGPFDLIFIDADSSDPGVQGVRRFFDLLAAQARVSATAIQTVGEKGHDGFALALVR